MGESPKEQNLPSKAGEHEEPPGHPQRQGGNEPPGEVTELERAKQLGEATKRASSDAVPEETPEGQQQTG
jgi:hypothetical protein